MPNRTQIPPEPLPRSPRTRRLVRWVVVSAAGLGAVALVGVLLLTWHFRATPTYAEYIASHPVSPAHFDSPVGGVELGGSAGWRLGAVDPFDVADDDPDLDRQEIRLELDILRGDSVSLRLVQVVALATERKSGVRVGASARTMELVVDPALRASACMYIWGAERMLESAEQRKVAFDVRLGAGSGASHVGVYGLPPDATWSVLDPPRGADSSGVLQSFLRKLAPRAELPENGLLHRVYAAGLTSARLNRGGMGPSHTDLQHEVSTDEYTYHVNVRISANGEGISMERYMEKRNSWSWAGEIW
jgi:hypothetical protein